VPFGALQAFREFEVGKQDLVRVLSPFERLASKQFLKSSGTEVPVVGKDFG
jgi:hypothetical protein